MVWGNGARSRETVSRSTHIDLPAGCSGRGCAIFKGFWAVAAMAFHAEVLETGSRRVNEDNQDHEQQIRELAYSLWRSAGQPYWTALEYWVMAEKMVVELMVTAGDRGLRGANELFSQQMNFSIKEENSEEPDAPGER